MLQQSPEKNKLFSTTFLSKPITTGASINHRKSLKWSTDEDNKLIEFSVLPLKCSAIFDHLLP